MHKLALFSKAIFAPELMAVEALQEWAQCRRMERHYTTLTGGEFKVTHAFYISMFALRYRTQHGDRVIWPNQYTWLLEQKLIDWKDHASWGLSMEGIRDKSKNDTATKLIALVEVSWFVVACIMRAAHALPISQLESMTLSYIPLFFITYFFWWSKPKDIRSPSIVDLPMMTSEQRHTFDSMAVSNKFDNEGSKDQVTYWNVWYLTPRVFEKEEEEQTLQKLGAKAAEKAAQVVADRAEKDHKEASNPESQLSTQTMEDIEIQLPKERVVAHWDPRLYRSKIWPLICVFGISFGVLHLSCWNTIFPSTFEMWLWRGSAFASILSMLIFMHFEKVVLHWNGVLTIISIVSPGVYFLSRILMMGEVFAALRAEAPAVYDTYEVSTYWAHLF